MTQVDAPFYRREKRFGVEGFVQVGDGQLVAKIGHEPVIDQHDDGDL